MPAVAAKLLAWYDACGRELPWRVRGGPADPYRVWLSEVMLQQTTVAAVAPYFAAFTKRWPSVAALAAADEAEVMAAWAGLGYYSRARNLHACARAVAESGFPADEAALRQLPGIGAYTAAAIAAIAFGAKAAPVDANIERVVARLFAIDAPLPGARRAIAAAAATLTPETRAGDFAQGLMDLGRAICTPRAPKCLACPLRENCAGFAQGSAADLPRKAERPPRPERYGTAFVARRADGAVLLRRRPPRGLLGGMDEVPSTEWGAKGAPATPPWPGDWQAAGSIMHTFTHFRLHLAVARAEMAAPAPDGMRWVGADALAEQALPTVMRKVLAAAAL